MLTGGGIKTSRAANITLLAIVFEGTLLVLALAIGWLLDRSPVKLVGLRWSGLVWGVVATFPLVLAVWWSARTEWPPIHRFIQRVEEKIFPLVGNLSRTGIVLISGMAGIAEEFMFRGVIQPGLAGPYGTTVALMVTSVLFGAAHLVTVTYAMIAALMGLYLGWIAIVSDNLLVPIIAHALYDFWALTYLIEHRGRAIRRRLERADAPAGPTPS